MQLPAGFPPEIFGLQHCVLATTCTHRAGELVFHIDSHHRSYRNTGSQVQDLLVTISSSNIDGVKVLRGQIAARVTVKPKGEILKD